MSLFDTVDLNTLTPQELNTLGDKLRTIIIDQVARTGGHLASNLGTVELTIALHLVYNTEIDRLVFDVGHQSYAHMLLTGREQQFSTLRQFRGLAGFPKPAESIHDAFVAGHASTSISVALGMARARTLNKETYDVVSVIGDGALTGGLAFEAMADAGLSGLPMVVVLNDNEMSITKNVGGVARHLAKLRVKTGYFTLKNMYHRLMNTGKVTRSLDKALHAVKTSVKEAFFPSSLFESMGFRYVGPVDGHDVATLTRVLRYAKSREKPVLVHINTIKGKGCPFAEKNPAAYHGVSGYELPSGRLPPVPVTFSTIMGQTLRQLADKDPRICAVTAAMGEATGLTPFIKSYPERFFDVGIAEGHAVTMAAGMAKQGQKPLCAIYSTFLQRTLDQMIHDVGISHLPVVFAVDRAGLVGTDGETHHGLFDVSYLNLIPGMTVLSPASFAELRAALAFAFEQTGPVAVRYPRGGELKYQACHLAPVVLREGTDLTLLTYGVLINNVLAAAEQLATSGISAQVVKLTRLTPLDITTLPKLTNRLLVVEESFSGGGMGERLLAALTETGKPPRRMSALTAGNQFVTHGSVSELYTLLGLDISGIAAKAMTLCDDMEQVVNHTEVV